MSININMIPIYFTSGRNHIIKTTRLTKDEKTNDKNKPIIN
jgi:hypothetical protein